MGGNCRGTCEANSPTATLVWPSHSADTTSAVTAGSVSGSQRADSRAANRNDCHPNGINPALANRARRGRGIGCVIPALTHTRGLQSPCCPPLPYLLSVSLMTADHAVSYSVGPRHPATLSLSPSHSLASRSVPWAVLVSFSVCGVTAGVTHFAAARLFPISFNEITPQLVELTTIGL